MQHNPSRLSARGPVDPRHGFPRWYKDAAGVRLEPAFDPLDPRTPALGDLPDPAAPVSFPRNFPDEAFYFLAGAELPIGGSARPGRARVVLALEAAFAGTGAVADDQQQVFARVRVRLDGGIPGAAYTFTHPYGQTDPLVADENGRVSVTDDVGAAPLLFDTAVTDGEVAPFLRWSADAPGGYLGDGGVEHTITGSPLGFDFFRVEGPGAGDVAGATPDPADPGNLDKVFTDLFTLQGRISTVAGAEATRAVYSRSSGRLVLDVFATSEPGQTLHAAGATMTGSGTGYHVRAAATAVPATVDVVNTSDVPPTVTTIAVTDAVTVTVADYDLARQRLSVEAASSDLDDPPVLTVAGFGPLTAGKQEFAAVDVPPTTITVASSHGGSDTRHVLVAGPAADPDPLTAAAGPDRLATAAEAVTLDAGASTGAELAYRWEQIAGTPVTLTGADQVRATFVAPAAGALEFRLTVQSAAGSATDTVSVQVSPAVPGTDTVTVDRAEFRTDSGRWRIEGTATGPLPDRVTVALDGLEIGSAPVDTTFAWDVRRTVIPGETGLTPGPGARVDVTTSRGGAGSSPVTIRD
ncbi:PKD domain-containing protein [Actinoplanes auranticolor]|uniref:PKD/Chitinase domain-containing protein n=1 Tax=Actinoplanes auranticolor TaxID=47988 RepID=A0A919SQL5_9ACTN|nr:PKD domain-containing protein [Actinoplanes auranticolor]GIM77205.1 hypothetical protein Aau02nite_74770 [Actinoplanes auranticolor]